MESYLESNASSSETLKDLILAIDDPRKKIVENIYNDYADLLETSPGSTHIHQVWPGGLGDHLADLFRLSSLQYTMLENFIRPRGERLPFTKGSADIVIFCHDAEKFIVYADPKDPRYLEFIKTNVDASEKNFKEDLKWTVLEYWEKHYGLVLTDAEINAIKYTHGEGTDYSNSRRVMNELAAFVGNVDRTSARILYNSGMGLSKQPETEQSTFSYK